MGLYEDSAVHIRVTDLTEGAASGSMAAMICPLLEAKELVEEEVL